jgi:hypothetical protein
MPNDDDIADANEVSSGIKDASKLLSLIPNLNNTNYEHWTSTLLDYAKQVTGLFEHINPEYDEPDGGDSDWYLTQEGYGKLTHAQKKSYDAIEGHAAIVIKAKAPDDVDMFLDEDFKGNLPDHIHNKSRHMLRAIMDEYAKKGQDTALSTEKQELQVTLAQFTIGSDPKEFIKKLRLHRAALKRYGSKTPIEEYVMDVVSEAGSPPTSTR